MKISEKYRNKALACEKLGNEAKDLDIKRAWPEIAIEWHSLANRIAQEVGQDGDIEVSSKHLERWPCWLQLLHTDVKIVGKFEKDLVSLSNGTEAC